MPGPKDQRVIQLSQMRLCQSDRLHVKQHRVSSRTHFHQQCSMDSLTHLKTVLGDGRLVLPVAPPRPSRQTGLAGLALVSKRMGAGCSTGPRRICQVHQLTAHQEAQPHPSQTLYGRTRTCSAHLALLGPSLAVQEQSTPLLPPPYSPGKIWQQRHLC